MEEKVRCPVCSSTGPFKSIEEVNGYEILGCGGCSLEFAKNMQQANSYYEALYYNATPALKGLEKLSHQDYLRIGRRLFEDASWQPHNTALRWIADNLKGGDTILDIGCGTGWVLAALETEGFKAVGVEVSERAVNMLRSKEFNVFRGPLEKCAQGFCEPKAVTMFEVIEHVQDPLSTLKEIHNKFPDVPLLVSVPTPYSWTVNLGIRSYCDYPPNHLTRWSEKSLKIALSQAGYKTVDFNYPKIPAKEIYGGLIIWLMYKLGLRKKGYFGELESTSNLKSSKTVLNKLVRLLYPVLNIANKLVEILFFPFAIIIAAVLNRRGFTSFCTVAIAQPT